MDTPARIPESPCTGVCRLDPAGTCLGCGRRMNEIVEWPGASPARKLEIISTARERLVAINRSPQKP
jgi:predicted Fe-S protein YdhL (DUF1289 family)